MGIVIVIRGKRWREKTFFECTLYFGEVLNLLVHFINGNIFFWNDDTETQKYETTFQYLSAGTMMKGILPLWLQGWHPLHYSMLLRHDPLQNNGTGNTGSTSSSKCLVHHLLSILLLWIPTPRMLISISLWLFSPKGSLNPPLTWLSKCIHSRPQSHWLLLGGLLNEFIDTLI